MKALRKIGDTLKTDDDKGIIIAVAIALAVIIVVVASYYLIFRPAPEGYTDVYVLDSQGRAANYVETLVVNQPTIYNIFVVNHENAVLQCELRVKVTNETISLFPAPIEPVSTFDKTVANGETWEQPATITLHEAGSHEIIFELWTHNAAGEFVFSGNAPVLNVDAVNPS